MKSGVTLGPHFDGDTNGSELLLKLQLTWAVLVGPSPEDVYVQVWDTLDKQV